MSSKSKTWFGPDGKVIKTRTVDLDAGTVTITENGVDTVTPLDNSERAAIERNERQQAKAQRLTDAIASLAGALDLDPAADFTATDIADTAVRAELRSQRKRQGQLASAVRALRIIVRDIIDEDA